jgi:hypothetical protein
MAELVLGLSGNKALQTVLIPITRSYVVSRERERVWARIGLARDLTKKVVVFSKSESRFHGLLRLAGKLDAHNAKRMSRQKTEATRT